jgi:hypothetical protein
MVAKNKNGIIDKVFCFPQVFPVFPEIHQAIALFREFAKQFRKGCGAGVDSGSGAAFCCGRFPEKGFFDKGPAAAFVGIEGAEVRPFKTYEPAGTGLPQQQEMDVHVPAEVMGQEKCGIDAPAQNVHPAGGTRHVIEGIIPAGYGFVGYEKEMFHKWTPRQ